MMVVSKDTTTTRQTNRLAKMNESMPMKWVSKDTTDQVVLMMDISKDTTNQAMSKMVVKMTNYKEETTAAGTKPESANKEPRPSLYTS
jgi:hypothetical protein